MKKILTLCIGLLFTLSAQAKEPFPYIEFIKCSNQSSDPNDEIDISVFIKSTDIKLVNGTKDVAIMLREKSYGYNPAGASLADGSMVLTKIDNENFKVDVTISKYQLSGNIRTALPISKSKFKFTKDGWTVDNNVSCSGVRYGN